MLKIAFIVKYYYPLKRPSGILRFVMNLSEKLGEKTNLTIITCKFNKKHPNKERFKNYDIVRVSPPFYVTSAVEAAKLKPDLIIFGTGISQLWLLFFVLFIFKFFNKLFTCLYNTKNTSFFLYQFVDLDYKYPLFVNHICDKVNKVICTNISLYNFYSKHSKINNIIYLPPGVDLLKLNKIKNKNSSNKFRIGFFGHLNYRKGSDILVRAFLKLDNRNMELFLAGLGNFKSEYKQLALKHKNIIIKEYINNIEETIASCDLIVFPYRLSDKILGLSLSAIEGLALEKPLIVSNNNCLRDLVEHGKNGYIFKNENELINYLYKMANDKELLEKFSVESRKKSENFDINIICNKLIDQF